MATTMTTPEKNSKKSGNKLLHRTVTICVILLLLLCVGLFFWHNKNATASDNRLEDSVAAQLGQLEGKSEAEIQEEVKRELNYRFGTEEGKLGEDSEDGD